MSELTIDKIQLPDSLKLKGEENYLTWTKAIEMIADIMDLRRYIHAKGIAPPQIDECDEDANPKEFKTWKTWEAGDSQMKMVIFTNCKPIPIQLLLNCHNARDMWTALQSHYESSGTILLWRALEDYKDIKLKNFPNLEQFIIVFNSAIEKLTQFDSAPPVSWNPIKFIMSVTDEIPIWAERQIWNMRNTNPEPTLAFLIEDLRDENMRTRIYYCATDINL